MFSSKSCEWTTPDDLFSELNNIYDFNLDPASTDENAKCERHYTIQEDGLKQPWGGYRVFCNPPYGRTIGDWVQKGYKEAQIPGTIMIMLLPARTDTKWFHDYCKKGKITFLKGRLKFGNSKTNAPFPSMVVEFSKNIRGE